jgi:hypothetical protein
MTAAQVSKLAVPNNVELLTFDPVGHGKSSFGHAALSVNGTTYSFGENGWFSESTQSYLKRNGFRHGVGQILNLNSAEASNLTRIIESDMGKKQQWSATNNCASKALGML